MKREITGLILIIVVVASIQIPSPIPFLALVLLVSLLAYREFDRLARAKGMDAAWPGGVFFSWALVLSFYLPWLKIEWVIPAALFVIPLLYLTPKKGKEQVLARVAIAVYTILYTGLLLGYMAGLKMMDDGGHMARNLLYFLFLVVCGSDTGAYYVGKTFGRHPLAPVLSPKKTIEGSVAGLGSAVLLALAAKYTFLTAMPIAHAVLLALFLGVISQLTDLIESMFKRSASVKDSSSFLPGHGGILDRIDSLAFAGPVMYYYYYFFHSP